MASWSFSMAMPANDLKRLLAEEPFVRALARSLVKGEADDVVQQAYLQALQQRPSMLGRPRAWLASIVRNLAADQRRRVNRRDARQRAAAVPERVPSSSELLEGEERRRALINAVDALPAELRTVVLLRYYDGLPPRRIAAELGVPVRTVWNRLHAALQLLRCRLDAALGERRAWLLPLVPFATAPRSMPWRQLFTAPAAPLFWGAMAMTKTKVTAVVAVLVLASTWALWPGGAPDQAGSRTTAPPGAASLMKADLPRGTGGPVPVPMQREAVALPKVQAEATGKLVVHVRYAEEPCAAAGLGVVAQVAGDDFRVGVTRAQTDADGTARFDGVRPGLVTVWTNRNWSSTRIEVEAGRTAECTLSLERAVTLAGVVVDGAGVPVAGALVEWTLMAVSGRDPETVAVTDAEGRFTIRGCSPDSLVGARAMGYAASPMHLIRSEAAKTEHVRIQLLYAGGGVEGDVVTQAGTPVTGAVVRVGKGRTDGIMPTERGSAPLPAQVVTGADGRFRCVGVEPGTQPVQVRAPGLAPWSGTCDVAAGMSASVRVILTGGVKCSGRVSNEAGEPVALASVRAGRMGDFLQYSAHTGADGTFTLAGLPVGETTLAAAKQEIGRATARIAGHAGATVRCELVLSNGLALRGRVVDDAATPVVGAQIRLGAVGEPPWTSSCESGREGRFMHPDCPVGRLLAVQVHARGFDSLQCSVDPAGGEVELRLQRDTGPRARIAGRLVAPDGRLPADVAVQVVRTRPQDYVRAKVRPEDGTFDVEVQAGAWWVQVESRVHPRMTVPTRQVEAGTTWDLGTIELVRGGTLLVHGQGAARPEYLVFGKDDQLVGSLDANIEPPTSELLNPGDYRLLVHGPGAAAQVLPFTIVGGQQTELAVRTTPGVKQVIEFVRAGGRDVPGWVGFLLRRDGKLAACASVSREGTGPVVREVWLVPGTYTLQTRSEPHGSATFTVGGHEGSPVRVELR